jgi:hypothetical protein
MPADSSTNIIQPNWVEITLQGKTYQIGPLTFGSLQRCWSHIVKMNKINDDPETDILYRHMARIRCALEIYSEALRKQGVSNNGWASEMAENITFAEGEDLLLKVFRIFDISGLKRGDTSAASPLVPDLKGNGSLTETSPPS